MGGGGVRGEGLGGGRATICFPSSTVSEPQNFDSLWWLWGKEEDGEETMETGDRGALLHGEQVVSTCTFTPGLTFYPWAMFLTLCHSLSCDPRSLGARPSLRPDLDLKTPPEGFPGGVKVKAVFFFFLLSSFSTVLVYTLSKAHHSKKSGASGGHRHIWMTPDPVDVHHARGIKPRLAADVVRN